MAGHSTPEWVEWAILIGVLGVLAVVTFMHPGMNILFYETSGLSEVKSLYEHGTFPGHGILVWGEDFYSPGPMYFLLLAVPYAIWPHVLSGYRFIGVLSLLAGFGLYLIGKRFIGVREGLWAITLYTCSWFVWASRVLNPLACISLISVLLLAVTLELIVRRRSGMVMLLLPLFAGALQIQLSILSVLPAIGWAVVCSRKWVRKEHVLVGSIVSLLLLMPYLLGGFWRDLPFLMDLPHNVRLERSEPYVKVLAGTVLLWPRFLSTIRFEPVGSRVVGIATQMSVWGMSGLWVAGLCYLVRQLWKQEQRHRRELDIFLLLWGLCPFLLWAISDRLLAFHYLCPAEVGHLLVIAILAAQLTSSSTGPTRHHLLTLWIRRGTSWGLALILVGNLMRSITAFLPGHAISIPVSYYGFLDSVVLSGHDPLWYRLPRLQEHPLFSQRTIFSQ